MPGLMNRDVFTRDPLASRIPNDGVARVTTPDDPNAWEVLRYELQSFVCEGEYEKGLERVLATFSDNLKQPQQPAVWVSGFYGSGKSHFARVLEHLWRDEEVPGTSGQRARDLVTLPADIKALLIELSRNGKQEGGLWSAAGTLGAGTGPVRLGLLGILFRSAGLPEQYPAGRFVLWLRQNGWFDPVKAGVEARGRTWGAELRNMYVSPYLADAVRDVVPGMGSTAEVRGLLKEQYPTVADVSDADLLGTMSDVLALQSTTPGKLPLTLLVFDELQQFIAEDPTRTLHVQNVVEACQAHFGSRLLFLGTGQSALQATPQLSKLQGRFSVRVTLSDADVEKVVREVVLRKRPDRGGDVKATLDRSSGEIDRHLAGTKIGPRGEDEAERVADYPLLPVRRRFWERTLRAIDAPGVAGQLRTQLRVVHEAVREVAEQPLGVVVPGDAVYWQQESSMLQSSVLDRDLSTTIRQLDDGTADGKLASRLCALIFLINKLPTEGPLATGLRATADALADLLVDDLTTGSGPLRARIPVVLQELVDRATLMLVGDEYRLQTRESSEWERDFTTRFSRINADDSRIASDRGTALRMAIGAALKGLTFLHGTSKVARKYELHFGPDAPPVTTGNVPVWVRDEWSASERAVRDEAQAAGVESPIVFVFLPRRDADELRRALARYGAADETVKTRPAPQTVAGQEARSAMESRVRQEAQKVADLIDRIVSNARVYQGGGNELAGDPFPQLVKQGVEAALARLFPRFAAADVTGWDKVYDRARDGNADALGALGYGADIEKHPACQEVRTFVGGAGKKGAEVRARFEAPPHGWSRDAVDGALVALVAAGHLRATLNGQAARTNQLTHAAIGGAEFFSEGVTISKVQLIELRALATKMLFPVKAGEEEAAVPFLLEKLARLASVAGGDPPLPERPDVSPISALQAVAGKQQVVDVHAQRDQLLAWFTEWSSREQLIQQRLPGWQRLEALRGHADGLPAVAAVAPQIDGIRTGRALLDSPDPVPPLLSTVATALRTGVSDARDRLQSVRDSEVAALEASAEWTRLPEADRQRLVQKYGLDSVPALDLGTDERLLASLEQTSLREWEDRIAALPGRAGQARAEAAKLLEPKSVSFKPPAATLKSEDEVRAYAQKLEAELLAYVKADTPVVIV
jgi:hypothetical protein